MGNHDIVQSHCLNVRHYEGGHTIDNNNVYIISVCLGTQQSELLERRHYIVKQLRYTASNLEGRSQVSQHVVIFSQEVVYKA